MGPSLPLFFDYVRFARQIKEAIESRTEHTIRLLVF